MRPTHFKELYIGDSGGPRHNRGTAWPPEQVDSELSRLQHLYERYSGQPPSVHPVLCAAWLHHRFVQIHPVADGNRRVGVPL